MTCLVEKTGGGDMSTWNPWHGCKKLAQAVRIAMFIGEMLNLVRIAVL